MRTSKKLLSLFLAVVMVITTCSVGFTAFAKDYDDIWTTSADAEAAFEAIEGLADDYLPSLLMSVDSISTGVYQKYADEMGVSVSDLTDSDKEEIDSKATLTDILQSLQTTLIELLAGKDVDDYYSALGKNAVGSSASYYEYLNPDDYSNSVSFYTLYTIAKDYKDNTSLSRSTRSTLTEWYNLFLEIYNISNSIDDLIDEFNEDFQANFDYPAGYDDWETTPTIYQVAIEDLESYFTDDYMAENCSESQLEALQARYDNLTEEYLGYGAPDDFSIDSFAEYIAYSDGIFDVYKNAYIMQKAVDSVSGTLSYTSSSDDDPMEMGINAVDAQFDDVNVDNALQVMLDVYGFDSVSDMLASMGYKIDESDDSYPYFEASLTVSALEFFYLDELIMSSNENYMTMIEGLTVCYGGITEDEFIDAVDAGMPDGWETGTVLSDEDIMDIGGYIRVMAPQSNDTTRVTFINSFSTGVIPNSLISSSSSSYAEDTDEDGTLPSAFDNTYYGQWLSEALDQSYGTYKRSTAFYYGFVADFASSDEIYNNSDLYQYYVPLQDGYYLHESAQTVDTEQGDDGVPYYYSGSKISQMGRVYPYMVRSENTHFAVLLYGDDYNYFSREDIDGYTDSALRYAYNQVALSVLGSDILEYSSYNSGGWHAGDGYFWFDLKYDDYIDSIIDAQEEEEMPTLTKEQEAILYDNYNLANDMGTEILNLVLNDTVLGIVGNSMVSSIIDTAFTSDLDLYTMLEDLWERLCYYPVQTIFELIPVLVVVVDDLLPFLLNEEGDADNGMLYDLLFGGAIDLSSLLGIDLMGYTFDYNSYIGISQIDWDLNELLPDLMHWLLATKEEQDNRTVDGIEYYVDEDTTDYVYTNDSGSKVKVTYTGRGVSSVNFNYYTVFDSDGNELAYDSDTGVYTYNGSSSEDLDDLIKATSTTTFYCMMTYEAKVPKLTGIYIADYYLADAKIEDMGSLLEDAGLDEAVADGLAEIITEFAVLFTEALDEYVVSDYRNEAKYKDGDLLCSGLNNVMVGFPRLIDIIEDLAADKYGGEADAWTFCYDGRIEVDTTGDVLDGSTLNVHLQEFKEYAGSSDSDRAIDILDAFVDGFVNDWLNSIIDLLNIVFTTDNSISNNIPIISGLLDSLGGLGEQSILSDILNSIFQLKRGDDYSFELLERDNGYVGLSSDSAYFLFANINNLVKVIVALVDSFSSDDSTTTESSVSLTSLVSSLLLASADETETTDSSVGSSGYTAEELSDVDTLISSLDEMVYALLENSTMNDYSLDNTGNIASGLVSLLSNYLTADLFEDSGLSETLATVIDEYIYYLDGAGTRSADENGDKVDEDVYTNENLSDLVVRTFALIEILAQDLLSDYDYINGDQTYNLLAQAISGVISPDAVAIRLDDYPDAQEDIYDIKSKGTGLWSSEDVVSEDLTDVKVTIDWGIEDGDSEAFYDGLSASLRILTSILGVLLVDAGIYENALEPIYSALCSNSGVEVMTADEIATTTNGYYDEVLGGILEPIVGLLDAFVESPVTTIIEMVQGLAGLLDDESGDTIASIVSNTLQPVINELQGLCNILSISSDKLLPLSETFADVLQTEVVDFIADYAVVEDNKLVNITTRNYQLCGDNIIPIINAYLSSTGITLPNISWSAISEAQSPADALAYVVEYAIDAVVDRDNDFANLEAIESLIDNDTATSVLEALKNGDIDGKGIIDILIKILNVTQNPTLVAWSFEQYLQEAIEGFSYPLGLTKAQADEAAEDIDAVIDNIFPLLESFGLDIGGSLDEVLSNYLFTNDLLTQLTVALYGALTSNSTVATVLDILTIPSSTADVAALLVDTSYGTTYSSASATIGAVSSWSDLKTVTTNSDGSTTTTYASINWGFTDGAANAQQGFVNALAAILRPFNDVLAVFLNSGELTIGDALYDFLCDLDVEETQLGDDATLIIEDGLMTFTIIDADKSDSTTSTIKIDLSALTNLKNLSIYGTNGYNSAIIPLLEALQCGGIVTDAQYQSDAATAKDNILLDILNPILGSSSTSLLNQITASPIVTIATILPNIAVYLDASGLSQAVNNLLAPITDLLADIQELVDLDTMLAVLLGASDGQSLADYVASLLGMSAGSVSLDLTNISTINLEDMLVPLLNLLLEDYNLVLADIDWNALISLGDRTTYTSAATDLDGNALTGKKLTNVDYGKSLIVVLRYVCNFLINNASSLQSLILSIKSNGTALSENATIKAIIDNIFTQIKTHTADEIILAIYYFFVGDNTDDYWDYSGYKTKKNTFEYPDGVSEDNIEALIEFLDGIIGELDLGSLLDQYLYTDSIINSLAKAMYQGIEGVTISGDITLNDIFDIVGMSCSKDTVVALLRDSSYGETKQFASAASAIESAASWDAVDFDSISWGVTDRDTFVTALAAVLRPFMGILDVILADGSLNILEGIDIPGSNDYVSTIVPLLEAFQCPNIKNYTQYLADKNKAYDNILIDVLNPILDLVDEIIESPIATIAQVLPNLALFIGNDGLVQLVENLLTPITAIVKDVLPIIDVDKLLQDLTGMEKLSITNIGDFLEPYLGGGNLISLLNEYLAVIGLEIPEIDWLGLASLGTVKNTNSVVTVIGLRKEVTANTSQVLVAVLQYVLDLVLDNATVIKGLIGDSYTGTLKEILDIVFDLSSDDIIRLLSQIVDLTQSPTEVFWTYEKYKTKYSTSFSYPDGITAEDADEAVDELDNMVSAIFALLQGLDVVDSADLSGLVSDLLFTNDMLTSLATALYGALDKDNISPYLEMLGIDVSTKGVAKLLTDKSYGKTYTSAAKAIKSKSSWSKVSNVNWGFTDGAANAEQGFINAMVAIFRPFLDILGPFLNGSALELGTMLMDLICMINTSSGDKSKGETLITMKNGVLKIKTQSNGKYTTALKLDFTKLETLESLKLYGSNGYENSIVPLLDALQVDNSEIKSYDQYVKDCKKAKDNILLDILNPLMSFVDDVLEAPFDTITSVLPNLAYFLDNNGVGQLLDNLLSPVTELLKDLKKDGIDIDEILELLLGNDLGTLITDLITSNGKTLTSILKKDGISFNLTLTNLKACNIQDILVPLINALLSSTGITLPDFEWSTIASHGEIVTSTSKAENSTGKFTNKEVIADKGEVLVAVLRYVADLLIKNADTLKSLLNSIDAIKNSDLLSGIISSVFNTLSIASKDQIVQAVFYFLTGEPVNAFWDYTGYETGEYEFSYPDNMDVDFLKSLSPMLDGLITGLIDLNTTVADTLYKDSIISSLAVGLYSAIEGVSISDSTTLTDLLAMTDIDFSTDNVAKLLTDSDYGQTYSSAAKVISSAGSWANVDKDSLTWGVTDRDSFMSALCAVLRPLYGVLDVLLNDAYLGLFDIVRIPGSNGYTSTIVPLLEAFSCYNIKTQYQYREDINEAYDNILLDIINPIWDKVEDLLAAPIQVLASMLPNLALFIGNDGLCQILDTLLTPVSALIDSIKCVVDLNDLVDIILDALDVDLNSLLAQIGITNFTLDLYDINATLKPILGGDAIIPLINNILGLIEIGDTTLGIKLNDVDWLQCASHGETIVGASQAATYGSRIYVEGDASETLIAVLRYLIDTVNAGDNFQIISDLIASLLGDSVSDSVSQIIDEVLGLLQGDTDEVISELVDLLQTFA